MAVGCILIAVRDLKCNPGFHAFDSRLMSVTRQGDTIRIKHQLVY
jgi:hypothetical protein